MAIITYPEILYDVYHNWGGDLSLSETNDLLLCSDADDQNTRSNQRILRRLFTNPPDYIWHSQYGAGIGRYVGMPNSDTTQDQIQATITANIFNESTVSHTPPPVITMQTIQNGIYVGITYTNAVTLQPSVINFKVE